MSEKRTTYIVNFISGPGSGKTTLAALTFANLKLKGYVVEYIQEFAKKLIWMEDYETLNNQYFVSNGQYKILKSMKGKVDFIVTDGPLINELYYNRHNKDNISNIEKTENLILNAHRDFNNINIFLKRGNFKYEQQGRQQNEEEAKEIDVILKHLLKGNNIEFKEFPSDTNEIDNIIEYIINFIN